jgi:hypothetical protein
MSDRDVCDNCGSELSEGHFVAGKLWCADCWSGRKPPVARPPNKDQQTQIEAWLAPKQKTCALHQAAPPPENTMSAARLTRARRRACWTSAQAGTAGGARSAIGQDQRREGQTK